MRSPVVALLLALGACATQPPRSWENPALLRQQAAEVQRARREAMTPEQRRRDDALWTGDHQAAEACQARADVAVNSYPDRSLLGLEAIARAKRIQRSCWDYYQRTGIVPGF